MRRLSIISTTVSDAYIPETPATVSSAATMAVLFVMLSYSRAVYIVLSSL